MLTILDTIQGAAGALVMVVAGLLTTLSLSVFVPIFIIKDEKLLMGNRAYNVAYAIGTFFFFPLAFGYCLFSWRGVRIPLIFAGWAFFVAVSTFVLRAVLAYYVV